jgi:hypothetical protein
MTIRRNVDELLATKLAAGWTVKAAAAEVGIGYKTACRRLADSGFRDRIVQLRREATNLAIGRLADGMAQAAERLRQLTESDNEGIRLKACVALLDLGLKAAAVADLEDRIRSLEQKLTDAKVARSLEQDRSQAG